MKGHEESEQHSEVIDPEVVAKAQRRRFSAAYKLRIPDEVDQCSDAQAQGRILRRESLYRSHLSTWRQQQDAGALAGLRPKKRGRKARVVDPQARRVAELERENARLRRKLEQAETIIGEVGFERSTRGSLLHPPRILQKSILGSPPAKLGDSLIFLRC